MATATDYFGYRYDTAHPAFIVMPHPPHPLDETGDPKLVYHRGTKRLYDWQALMNKASADGYVWPTGEVGSDDAWLDENTEYGATYEYTLSLDMTASADAVNNVYYKLTGPATATKKQTVYLVDYSDTEMPYLGGVNAIRSFDILPGDTLATIGSKIANFDYRTTENATGWRKELVTSWTAGSQRVQFRLNMSSATWDNPMDYTAFPLSFHVYGMNFPDGVNQRPSMRATVERSADNLELLITITGTPYDPPAPWRLSSTMDQIKMGSATGNPANVGIVSPATPEKAAEQIALVMNGSTLFGATNENVTLSATAIDNKIKLTGVTASTTTRRAFDNVPQLFFY